MAEIQSSQAIVPTSPSGSDARNASEAGGYTIMLNRFNAAGQSQPLSVHLPANITPDVLRTQPVLLAAVLKDGDPVWSPYDASFVLIAALKAAGLGLDLLEGDIYPVQGRLGISDWAKIKYARSKGFYATVEMKTGSAVTWPWKTKDESGIWQGTNDECVVKVFTREDKLVNTYATTLKAWWVGHSKEWRERSAESLRRKCIARAYQEVCPVGVDPDEAPPLAVPDAPPPRRMTEHTQGAKA